MNNANQYTSEEEIFQIIRNEATNEFTVSQIHDYYRKSGSAGDSAEKSSRQLVYRNVAKLENAGKIQRISGTNGKAIYYSIAKQDVVNDADWGGNRDFERILQKQLEQLNTEFLTSLGEAELYKELLEIEIEFKSEIHQKYKDKRDHSTKLLGKIKAAEGLLKSCRGEAA